MTRDPQICAEAAADAYVDRQPGSHEPRQVFFRGHEYVVFGYKADRDTGFHATAYEEVAPPHNIIIAFRGTDTDLFHHTATTIKDAAVDFRMLRDRINPQEPAAARFTAEMIRKAQENGISKDHITVAGHSLGGTLAEIEAWTFGLRGMTVESYGAVDLGYCVPEGGTQVTNYVMANDVVSAATRHFGEVVPLASDADVEALEAARYLDAGPGALPPNPLLAMRLADHGIGNFAPDPGSGQVSVLDPAVMARYARNYAEHREAFERFRGDVYRERAELAEVLRNDDNRDLASIWAKLSPQTRRQFTEWHATLVDTPIIAAVAQHPVFAGLEQAMDRAGAAVRSAGAHERNEDERAASDLRRVGAFASAVAPTAPNPGAFLGEVLHLYGQVAHAGTQLAADGAEAVGQAVGQAAYLTGRSVAGVAHDYERVLLTSADFAIGAQQRGAAVTRVMDAARRALPPDDPRHPDSPGHGLYRRLEASIPEAGEDRLLQFTATCHANGMTARNLGQVYHDRQGGTAIFLSTSPLVPAVTVDLTAPAPEPEHSIARIAEVAHARASLHARDAAALQTWDAQAQQAPQVHGLP